LTTEAERIELVLAISNRQTFSELLRILKIALENDIEATALEAGEALMDLEYSDRIRRYNKRFALSLPRKDNARRGSAAVASSPIRKHWTGRRYCWSVAISAAAF
jgi:hypothetical protein